MITQPISTSTYCTARRRRRRGVVETGSAWLVRAFFTWRPWENTVFRHRVQVENQKYKRKNVSSTAGSPIVFLLTTLEADADGAAFARTLVDEKLAACVSVLPAMTSVYRWKGSIEE